MSNETALQTTNPDNVEISPATGWTYRPAVDIVETADALILETDLPGADADSIDVSVESGVLTINAHVRPRQRRGKLARQEYGVGNFHRRFSVDDTIDVESIEATYDGGVLTLTLPKSPRTKRQRIEIKRA